MYIYTCMLNWNLPCDRGTVWFNTWEEALTFAIDQVTGHYVNDYIVNVVDQYSADVYIIGDDGNVIPGAKAQVQRYTRYEGR